MISTGSPVLPAHLEIVSSEHGATDMKRDKSWTGFYFEHDTLVDGTPNDEPSRTRQEFADECDINNIMRRFEATGVISHVDQREPMYVDLTELPRDLHSVLRILDSATESFMSLPAMVRREFDNDPHQFIAFAEKPENLGKMREWGLAPPETLPDAPREPLPPSAVPAEKAP